MTKFNLDKLREIAEPRKLSKAEEKVKAADKWILSQENGYKFRVRDIFVAGYEQAEKDLELTWEDVQLLDHFVLELVREEKEGKDWGDGKEFYTEVLTRFKQFKEAKK